MNTMQLALAPDPVPDSKQHFIEALRIFTEIIDHATEARALLESGLSLQAVGADSEARSAYERAAGALGRLDPAVLPARYVLHTGALYLDQVQGESKDAPTIRSVVSGVMESLNSPSELPPVYANASLTMREEDRVVTLPSGARLGLRRRLAPWRILNRLARERTAAPGHALTVDELVAAGWPGEIITPHAAANRVYFVIRTLRKNGLEGVLLTIAEGYVIDPRVEVVWDVRHLRAARGFE